MLRCSSGPLHIGWWQGKAFSKKDGMGYNTFFDPRSSRVSRRRPFQVVSGPSAFDGRASLHLVYAKHNDGLIGRLHDELRCLNDDVFLGLGSSAGEGKRAVGNSTPFLICGPSRPLRKCESEYN